MKRGAFVSIAACALFAAGFASADSSPAPTASATPPAPVAASKKQKVTVAAMGDSLTDAKSHGGGYIDYLKKKCPKSRFDNYGKGGQMVNQMRKRFAADVLGEGVPDKPAYTHVIVFGGVNDLYSDDTAGRTPEKIESDLLRMYKAAKGKGMKVVALTIAPWGGFTKYFTDHRKKTTGQLNKWISDQVTAKNVDYVVDAFSLLSCGDANKLCPKYAEPFKDGLHFGAGGHEVLGKALFDKVFSDCE
ncbi:MAG: SGNH/GDSL hydrolase family protein [Polyangiaceae bacterium]|nr:SGNH/GDSL hydrolase family protein [Polyangiaceae bacterium]